METLLTSKEGTRSRNSVGIANVHQRIQLYFGTEYGLSYASVPGSGTSVTLVIPAVHADEWQRAEGCALKSYLRMRYLVLLLIPLLLLGYAVYQWSKEEPGTKKIIVGVKALDENEFWRVLIEGVNTASGNSAWTSRW